MNFVNHSGSELWLGLYTGSDHLYGFSLFPFGRREHVAAGGSINLPAGLPERVQAVVWNAPAFGSPLRRARCLSSSYAISYAEDADGKHLYQGGSPPTNKDKVEHLFVLMMENRSFDHLFGWLYEAENNTPPRNIPRRTSPTFDGLTTGAFWNNADASKHDSSNGRVLVGKVGANVFTLPNPNPPEICPRFVENLFGTESPIEGSAPNNSGFIQAYAKVPDAFPVRSEIMQCYTPTHVPRLSALAREYAVCDRWFSSIPCMTYPNRSFLHAGTCFGRLNNNNDKYSEGTFPADPVPNVFAFAGKRTVFDELDSLQIPYGLYTSSQARFTLLGLQFFTIPQKVARPFKGVDELARDLAGAGTAQLPLYTFIEPEYWVGANDQHPPADVRVGDAFIGKVYDVIRSSPNWRKSVLVVLYDEHGGTYDHVPPPTAARPDGSPLQFQVGGLDPMQIYGPRVPAVVVSPLIEPGTVFRSFEPPHDHSSILSSLKEMMYPFGGATPFFAGNPRVARAPTVWTALDPEASSEGLDFSPAILDLLLD